MECYSQAKTLWEENIVWFAEGLSTSATLHDPAIDLCMVAICQNALGEVDSGIATLHRAIDEKMLMSNPSYSTVRTWLFFLEHWYIAEGLWDSAAQVHQRAEDLRPSIIQNNLTQSGR